MISWHSYLHQGGSVVLVHILHLTLASLADLGCFHVKVTFGAVNARLCKQVAEATAHPMLTLLANSEQPLTTRYSRRLVTMCKSAAYDQALEQQAFAEGAPLM